MYRIEFLAPLAQKPEIITKNAAETMAFCKAIDWLQEVKNYYRGYRSSGDEMIHYQDYWYMNIIGLDNESTLNIFTEYIDEREIFQANLKFIITYSWHELKKTGGLTRFFSGKSEKKIWKSRHISGADSNNMERAIKCFVSADITILESILSNPGDYSFDPD